MSVLQSQILFLCGLWISVTAQNNIGKFWHVTDFHYDTTYWDRKLSCNGPVPNPGPYGDYWCDSPWSLVQSAISFMGTEEPDVDFVIWTGDTIAHIKNEDTSLEENINILQNVTSTLETALPGIPVYASLGNHDFYPDGQAEMQRSEMYEQVADMWKAWIGSQAQVDRFEEGGFYSAMLNNGNKLRLLALNTNLYYTSNDLTETQADPAGQMAWMSTQLDEARAAGQKVLVTGHVPPGLLTPDLVDWFYPEHKESFMNVIFNYSDVIIATHFGHDHHDGFKILQNSDESRATTQFTAPSVTPWRYKFTTSEGEQTGDPHNPGVRLVHYDRDTGAHIDYQQFYINLTDSNIAGETNWSLLYSFRDAYDVTDMSVSSLKDIFERVKDGGAEKYTSLYCMYSPVSALPKTCTDQMRGEIYCAGIYYDLETAQACVEDYLKRINSVGSVAANGGLILAALFSLHLIQY